MTKKKKSKNVITDSPEASVYHEMEKIMDYLGRKHTDGVVKGDNLTKILSYLIVQKSEPYDKTTAKLSLMCGMMQRYVKENYLQGLEAFGFINVYMNGTTRVWEWIGIK